jgi:hypothetical protein
MTTLPEGRSGSDKTCRSGTALKQQAVNVQLHFKSPQCNPPADHQNLQNSSVLTAAQCELQVFPHGKQQQCLTYLSKGYIQRQHAKANILLFSATKFYILTLSLGILTNIRLFPLEA